MTPKLVIGDYLKNLKKKTISLTEMELLFSGTDCSYQKLAESIQELESEGILQMIVSKGRNGKSPSLAYHYRLHMSGMKHDFHTELHQSRLRFHSHIQLDSYFSLGMEEWNKDLRYIELIDQYLSSHDLPIDEVPAPERSFELVGNEKWITELNGQQLLERIGLWSKLRIVPVADPLMMAINPVYINKLVHNHLIVENKTTYQALLQVLSDVPFTSLIYGCGKKIIKSIELFHRQLPLSCDQHRFYYFGDIDKEGINIWHSLNLKTQQMFGETVNLALPFYKACLEKNQTHGKETQREDEAALNGFISYFTLEEQALIRNSLANGGYYPQEILRTHELCQIWRKTIWSS
jgi:hypothetical protein